MPAVARKVKEDLTVNILEQYFEQNILNRDFRVYLATNLGTDITSTYDGYLFRLLKNTNYDGPMTASKNGTVLYTGTWSTNEDFGKLVITLNTPSVPAEFVFLNRQWRFTEKGIPIMKLAPGVVPPTSSCIWKGYNLLNFILPAQFFALFLFNS